MIEKLIKYGPVQGVAAMSVFGLLAIQTRLLTLTEFGMLAFALVAVELVRMLTTQWIVSSLLRLYPSEKDSKSKNKIAGMCGFLLLIAFIMGSFMLAGLQIYFDEWSVCQLIALILLYVVKSIYTFQIEFLRLNENTGKYQVAVTGQSVIVLISSFLSLYNFGSVISAICAIAASYLIINAWLFFTRDRDIFLFEYSGDFRTKILAYGMPLIGGIALATLASRVDRLVLVDLISTDKFAIYSAYYSLYSGVFGVIFMVVATPLYPELIRASSDSKLLGRMHLRYLNLILYLTLPVMLFFIVFSNEVAVFLLGSQYAKQSLSFIIPLIFFAYLVNVKNHYFDHAFQFTLKTAAFNVTGAVFLLVSAAALYFVASDYGIAGAALSMLMAIVATLLTTYYMAKRFGYVYQINCLTLRIVLVALCLGMLGFVLRSIELRFGILYVFLMYCGLLMCGLFINREVIMNVNGARHE